LAGGEETGKLGFRLRFKELRVEQQNTGLNRGWKFDCFEKGIESMKLKKSRASIESRQLSGMDAYLASINEHPLLTAEEEYAIAQRAELGDEEARNKLVEANLRLVVNIARSHKNKDWIIEDLIEEGNLGLIEASKQYKVNAGTRFSTYASYWIHQAIHRAMVNSSRLIRLPAYMVETISKWRRAEIYLEEELHRPPYSEEIARRIGLHPKRMNSTLLALNACKMAAGQDTSDGLGLEGLIVDERERSPDEIYQEKHDIEKVQEELGKLSEREVEVLSLRYGIVDGQEHTLRDVGHKLNITRERVRQIGIEAIEKLSSKFE